MQELLVVNPSRRPSKRRKSTKAASPAQKRARAKFAAMARARAGKTRKSPRRAKRAKSTSLSIMTNPKKRTHHKRRARRRNPSARSGMSILRKPMALISPALVGAVGATAVNTILAKLPVPASLNTGKMRYVTQGAAAIALAAIASKLGVKGSMAAQMAEGSLTVTIHQAITDIAGGFGMNLSGMGYYLPGYGVRAAPSPSANPARLSGGMGKYVTGPGSLQSAMPAQSNMRGFGFR